MSDVDRNTDDTVAAHQEGKEALSPWLGWVLGPAAWALHQGIGYAMVPWICAIGVQWPYHVLTLLALSFCAAGALSARHALRRSHRVRPPRSASRLRMMALVGLMFSAMALLGITVEYAGSFFLEFCGRGTA